MVDPFENLQPLQEFRATRLLKADGRPVGDRTLRNYVNRGDIPIVKIGTVQFVDLKKLASRIGSEPRRRGRPRLSA